MISKKGISKQMRRANWKREVLERAAQKKYREYQWIKLREVVAFNRSGGREYRQRYLGKSHMMVSPKK